MIPYFEVLPLEVPLGFTVLSFHAFGALVALGFIVGTQVAAYRAKKLGLKESIIFDAALRCIIFGIIGAHLLHVLAYDPQSLLKNPLYLLKFWSGLSSFGGFIGATLGVIYFLKKKGLSVKLYGDALVFGLIPGQMLGRIGCYLAHDHPGKLTDFFLAVNYPGGPRHDLGFYEFLFCLVLFIVMLAITKMGTKRTKQDGFVMYLTMVLYGIARLFFDSLRATDIGNAYVSHVDARYFGFTPAQYISAGIIVFGIFLLFTAKNDVAKEKR